MRIRNRKDAPCLNSPNVRLSISSHANGTRDAFSTSVACSPELDAVKDAYARGCSSAIADRAYVYAGRTKGMRMKRGE